MPSLIDLRRRIRSVKNTQQITKAMKMVAASKLRRAQERIVNARPYAVQMQRVLMSVASRVDPARHPLLAVREPGPDSNTLVIVVTADKGLCGGFNTNLIKAAGHFVASSPTHCTMGLLGRKGRDFFVRRGFDVMFERTGLLQKPQFSDTQAIAREAMDAFLSGQVDAVVVIYNEFKSVMSQHPAIEPLLPIGKGEVSEPVDTAGVDYLYEPSAQLILDTLLPRYVEAQLYRAVLETNAGFYGAQMTAMDTATKNSTDMIASLTLYMNKVRQAAITREIIEVVSGAEAL